MAIAGKIGAVYRSNGASVAFTNEAMTGNATYTRYAIANNDKRFWDKSAGVTVKKNGGTITTGFTVEYAGGVIVFDPAILGTDVITVSGKNFPIVQCATFFNWKLDVEADLKDITTFASAGWAESLPVINKWNASAEGFWADDSFINLFGSAVLMSLFIDVESNIRYEGVVYLKKNSITEPVDDVVKENIEISGDGELYYHDV